MRPPGVSKRSVVELRGKDQQIDLAEYSRLVVFCFGPRSIFDTVMAGQRSNFRKFHDFSTLRTIPAKLSIVAALNLHQRVPRSIRHRMRCFKASRMNI